MPTLELIELVEPATVTSGGSGAPASGTVETWDFTGTLPAIGTNQQFRLLDTADKGDLSGYETVLATANASGALTVTRGADGTTPKAHSSGFRIIPVITPAALDGRYLNAQSGGFTIGTVDFYESLTDTHPMLTLDAGGITSSQSPSATPISAGAFNFIGSGASVPTLYVQDATGAAAGTPLAWFADHSANAIAWLRNSGGFAIVDNIASTNGVNSIPPITIGRSGGTGYGWGLTLNSLASPVVTPSLGSGGSLSASTEYFYTVVPVRADGAQGVGIEVHDTTTSLNKTIVLAWPHVGGANEYLVYRSTVSGSYGSTSLVGTVLEGPSGASLTFSDNGITATTGSPNATNAALGAIAAPINTTFSGDAVAYGFVGNPNIGMAYDTTNGLRLNANGGTINIGAGSALGGFWTYAETITAGESSEQVANTQYVQSSMVRRDLINRATVNVMDYGADNTFSPTNLSAGVSTTAFEDAYAALPTRSFPAYSFASSTYSSVTLPVGRFEIPSGGYNLDQLWKGENYDFGPFVEVVGVGGRGSAILYYTGGGASRIVIQATNPYNADPLNVGDNPATVTSPQGTGTYPAFGFQRDTVAGSIKNLVIDGSLMTLSGSYTPTYNSSGVITNAPMGMMIAGGESYELDVIVRNWNFPTYGQGIAIAIQGFSNNGGFSGSGFSSWTESGRYKTFTVNCDVHVAYMGGASSSNSRSFNNTIGDHRIDCWPGQIAVLLDSGALLYHSHLSLYGVLYCQMPISKVAIPAGSYSLGSPLGAISAYPLPAYYNGMQITVGSITGIIQGAVEGGTTAVWAPFPTGTGYLFQIVPINGSGVIASGTLGSTQNASMVTVSPPGPPAYFPRNYALTIAQLGFDQGGTAGVPKLISGSLDILMESNAPYIGNIATSAALTASTTYGPGATNPIPATVHKGIIAGTSFTITGDPNNNVFICAANAPAGSTSVEVESITIPSGGTIASGGTFVLNIPTNCLPGSIFLDDDAGGKLDVSNSHLDLTGGGQSFKGVHTTSGNFTTGFNFNGVTAGDPNLTSGGAEEILQMSTVITSPHSTTAH